MRKHTPIQRRTAPTVKTKRLPLRKRSRRPRAQVPVPVPRTSPTANASNWLSNTDSQINKLTKSLLNRDAFSYDAAKDPLYQQYADQYTKAGNLAMQDTLGEVSARTGGLASSYATGASQGAYNSYMQQLAAKVPELYSLAYSMYQDEGDRQLSNLNMLRGLQSDDYTQYNTDRSFAASQAQQTKENQWTEEQIARGVKQDVLEAAMSNSLSQSQWEAKREQYMKTGKGGADVANYETYFDYMTGLTDYYAERLKYEGDGMEFEEWSNKKTEQQKFAKWSDEKKERGTARKAVCHPKNRIQQHRGADGDYPDDAGGG